jgi:hypothetical protein
MDNMKDMLVICSITSMSVLFLYMPYLTTNNGRNGIPARLSMSVVLEEHHWIVSRVAVRIPVGCNLGQKALRFQRHALNRITGKLGVIRSGRVLSYMRNNEMFHRNIPKKMS